MPIDDAKRTLLALRRPHLIVDGDCWFSCPLAIYSDGASACCNDEAPKECDCGADTHNRIVDFLLGQLEPPTP